MILKGKYDFIKRFTIENQVRSLESIQDRLEPDLSQFRIKRKRKKNKIQSEKKPTINFIVENA